MSSDDTTIDADWAKQLERNREIAEEAQKELDRQEAARRAANGD